MFWKQFQEAERTNWQTNWAQCDSTSPRENYLRDHNDKHTWGNAFFPTFPMKYIIVVDVTSCHLGIAIWRSIWLFTKERSPDKCKYCKCILYINREQMWDWNRGATCFKCCSLWTLFQRELKYHMHENTKYMSEEDELQFNASDGWICRTYCADIWTRWVLIVCLKCH